MKGVFFRLPQLNQTLICCDGAAKGNPGAACIGFIARQSDEICLGDGSGGLGVTTNYIAEVMALITTGECAVGKHLTDVCFSLDSKTVILAFTRGKVPWIVKNRWRKMKKTLRSITFRHSYREVNFSADQLAKKGITLGKGVVILYEGRPNFLRIMEQEDAHYFRFT
ncbi:uncharacterized protein LOC113315406 [Papaver somniferum]|uniref:uncharacterized protein LOC113315406 n=1 Tax=Papaver somniferum TaxID=3469 RepID=UPI000E6FD1B0|nr:uncharacterized protein LOC113315406 [Papaver somniferum]